MGVPDGRSRRCDARASELARTRSRARVRARSCRGSACLPTDACNRHAVAGAKFQLSSHREANKMPANRPTWNSERIELLKRHFNAGLSCSQIAGEIGVTRNAVIGKMNRLGLSRPRDLIAAQQERRHAAGLLRARAPGISATGPYASKAWHPKRARVNIFAQHEMLAAEFPQAQPHIEDVPIANGLRMHAARARPGEMPLADRQPGRRGLPLLRERAGQGTALLPRPRAHRLSAGRAATRSRVIAGFGASPARLLTAAARRGRSRA